MPILLNKISTKGGRGGQKSPKSCLRRIWMPPDYWVWNESNINENIKKLSKKIYSWRKIPMYYHHSIHDGYHDEPWLPS